MSGEAVETEMWVTHSFLSSRVLSVTIYSALIMFRAVFSALD